jgi:hypothetical protein
VEAAAGFPPHERRPDGPDDGGSGSGGSSGYKPLLQMLRRHRQRRAASDDAAAVLLAFTCVEMRDEEQAGVHALCRPQALVAEVATAAAAAGVPLAGENALLRFDAAGLDTIVCVARPPQRLLVAESKEEEVATAAAAAPSAGLESFTFLRMRPELFDGAVFGPDDGGGTQRRGGTGAGGVRWWDAAMAVLAPARASNWARFRRFVARMAGC